MVLLLAEHLGVPLRERNALLLAAGYAPIYPERSLEAPSLDAARSAIDLILKGHEPYPAVAVDRHWTLLAYNNAVTPLLSLLLWFAGIYLFYDRMAMLGGYQHLAVQLGYSAAVVGAMALSLTLWVAWNLRRYGHPRNRRRRQPAQVSDDQMAEATQLPVEGVRTLRASRDVRLYFDDQERPVVERPSGRLGSYGCPSRTAALYVATVAASRSPSSPSSPASPSRVSARIGLRSERMPRSRPGTAKKEASATR